MGPFEVTRPILIRKKTVLALLLVLCACSGCAYLQPAGPYGGSDPGTWESRMPVDTPRPGEWQNYE